MLFKMRTMSFGESSMCLFQDNLILKRIFQESQHVEASPYHTIIPNIILPGLWIERMKLRTGDRIVLSRPPSEYSLPPPEVCDPY